MTRIRIRKPNDSGEFFETQIGFGELSKYLPSTTISGFDHRSPDPIHAAICQFWQSVFRTKRGRRYRYSRGIPKSFTQTVQIGALPFLLERRNSRYYLNGSFLSLSNLCDVLARVLYRSCFTQDAGELMKNLYSAINVPEAVSYVIENRIPYFFYENYEKHEVRLNVQRIGDNTCAVEISDGVWGQMSFKDVEVYSNFYRHGKKKGSWVYLSPKNLFTRLMKRSPSEAELNLMIAFLQQNRKQDIVEERALSLIRDMVEEKPYSLFPVWKGNELVELYVRGAGWDWKLTSRGAKQGTQLVSTFVYQPDSEGTMIWKGPICIDNMTNTSSIGDQFATRAMAFLNDTMTVKLVSTISGYLSTEPNKNRMDINEMLRMSQQ